MTPTGKKKPDILCISTTDWYEIWGSRQQVMLQFVQAGYRVLFVERQVGPEHLWRNPDMRRRKLNVWRNPRLNLVQPNLWRWQPPLMPPGRYYSLALNQVGQRWLTENIKTILRKLDFNVSILWMYPPHSAPLLGQFGEKLAIYHCIERFAGEQTGRKRQVMLAQEESLLRNVDQVFVHSDGLRQLYSSLTQRPIVLTPSAANVAHYQSTDQIHPAMSVVPQPRLVVMGTMDERIDWSLLLSLAHQKPDWHLVLIGQIRSVPTDFVSLRELPNVHYLGKHPFDDLPLLLNGADVTLIPYKMNEMTRFISPLKAYEYLAVGKPIVSVDMPEMRALTQWCQIVLFSGQDTCVLTRDIIRAIAHALETDSPEKRAARRKAALQHTWRARTGRMQAIIETLLGCS
ncbi:MAG: glycosyltransferase [Chloroflexi bacterium]|nr:glycosyltransferase [Chloroflexota bacterium]